MKSRRLFLIDDQRAMLDLFLFMTTTPILIERAAGSLPGVQRDNEFQHFFHCFPCCCLLLNFFPLSW